MDAAAAEFAAEIETLMAGRRQETQRWVNESHAEKIAELVAGVDPNDVLHGDEADGGTMVDAHDNLWTWDFVPGAFDGENWGDDTIVEARTPISDLPAAVQAALKGY